MAQVLQRQIRKLGTHARSRNGIRLMGVANALNCANFALNGAVVGMADARSPDSIYSSNGHNQVLANAILDIDPFRNVVAGLRATATAANHPLCAAELVILNANIVNAIAGNRAAGRICSEAMVKIVARKNGLIPGVVLDKYQLHMKGTSWFGWDHWALSIKSEQAGKPRIYIQTTTGTPLNHACNTIWDEHLGTSVTVNLQQLHVAQVALINRVTDFGDFCCICEKEHGRFKSRRNSHYWHRCLTCRAVYCSAHGNNLGGLQADRTRGCGQIACAGRTERLQSI